MQRGRVFTNVTKQLLQGGGGAMLYQPPGTSTQVVAHVLESRENGLTDICWFDNQGRRQVALDVNSLMLKAYEIDNENVKAVYIEALNALSARAEGQQDAGMSSFSLERFGSDLS